METLPPGDKLVYSWDEPLGQRSVVVERSVEVSTSRAGRNGGVVGTVPEKPAGGGPAPSSKLVGIFSLDLARPSRIVGGLRAGEPVLLSGYKPRGVGGSRGGGVPLFPLAHSRCSRVHPPC